MDRNSHIGKRNFWVSSILLSISVLFIPINGYAGVNERDNRYISYYPSGKNPSNFITINKKPTLWVGDSVTQGWMECGQNFDLNGYLDAIAANGMNLVMMWSYIGTDAQTQINDNRIGYDAPEIFPWSGSPEKRDFDLTRFNDAYFKRIRRVAELALARELTLLITVHDGGIKWRYAQHPFNDQLGNGPLDSGAQYVELEDYAQEMPKKFDASWSRKAKNQYFQERFCEKLIHELRLYPNVVYELFNEGEWYDKEMRRKHELHFLAFFNQRCDNFIVSNSDHIMGDHPYVDPLVNVISIHGAWTNRFQVFEQYFDHKPPKPILFSEPVPGWGGDAERLSEIRRSMWETALAGVGWVNQNDTSFGWDRNSKMQTKTHLRDLAYKYAGICSRFFNNGQLPFWRMKPDHEVSSTGICMTDHQTMFIAYAPQGGIVKIDMRGSSGNFDLRWFNPLSGVYLTSKTIKGGSIQSFDTPTMHDWVLLIQKK